MRGSLAFVYTTFSLIPSLVDPVARNGLVDAFTLSKRSTHLERGLHAREDTGDDFSSSGSLPEQWMSGVLEVVNPADSASPTPSSGVPASSSLTSAITASSSASPPSNSTEAASPEPSKEPQSVAPADDDDDIALIATRRVSAIIGGISDNGSSIDAWVSTLGSNGKWPDSEVDYTTGCSAQRANWPAQAHWTRILSMASAWHGGLPGGEPDQVKSDTLRAAITSAMDYWFSRDFPGVACLDYGGTDSCPCSNPNNTLWNTNWFSNIILIPKLVSQTCLVLNDTLSDGDLAKCLEITGRSYDTFYRSINGVGQLTGANTLDVARVGMDKALLTNNATLLNDAYQRVQAEMVIQHTVRSDGIRDDGSFGQHDGIIYNGNYGKDFTNDMLEMEIEAAGTQYAASTDAQSAFATLFDGDKWMIVRNNLTNVLHWDFSVLGRFLVFPVTDDQPVQNISLNLTQIEVLGEQWGNDALTNFAQSLQQPPDDSANAGKLYGNRMFFANDYMIHRGKTFVTTVKLWSTRTRDSECTNSANPLGYHLADGVQYTYTKGNEYENVPGAWDWNLIPGTTVDYNGTPLNCGNIRLLGVESFAGGVSDGQRGIAAMRYTNAVTKALRWQKAWFFLDDDVELVMIANISSSNSAPIYSVLDQRHRAANVLVNNQVVQTGNYSNFQSLWHGDVGYTFNVPSGAAELSIQLGSRQGNWSNIGTSTAPPFSIDLFAAWIHHKNISAPISYTVYPGTKHMEFETKSAQTNLQTLRNDNTVSAVYDQNNDVVMVVFWTSSGGSVSFTRAAVSGATGGSGGHGGSGSSGHGHGHHRHHHRDADDSGMTTLDTHAGSVTLSANAQSAIIYRLQTGDVTVSDPGQSVSTVQVNITGVASKASSLTFNLPSGGLAGSSVTKNVSS